MNVRKFALTLTLTLWLAGVAVCYASDPSMATWKMNEAKSMIPAGVPKNTTVTYEAAGRQIKVRPTEFPAAAASPTKRNGPECSTARTIL
jgi:hypothetical protein